MSKILIVGPAYPFRGGGITTFNERLAQEFINMGHECDILSFSLQYPSLLFPGKTQYSSESPQYNLKIHSLINSINPFNWVKVGKRFKKEKYDVVIFRYWMSFMAPAFGTIARIIRKNNHTKVLAICDNLIPHEKKFFDIPFAKYFISACDGFLTMSHSVKQELENWQVKQKVIYSPHPMYDMYGDEMPKKQAKQALQLDAETNYLLFFGFIRKYKGLHLLLDAFADERLNSLNLKLIVAGEFYEDAQPYFEQIKNMGLQERVILSNDFIPNGEVSKYFCAADCVVQTYLNATQSGVTQIAYFYNKPMIVTNVGGLAELVPDNKVGFVTEVNKTAVADAILRFYNERKEAEMIENIKVEKQQFTWQHICKRLLELA